MLIKSMTVGNMAVCCYIVACDETREGMIIDPGGNEEDVLVMCEREKVHVKYIVNTHGHPDHVCGNARLKKATGAKIVMHEEDAAFIAKPDVEQFFSVFGLQSSPPVDMTVKDGDTITVGTVSFDVIHTPGHTPGGMCLYSPPNVFTGDTLFVGGVGRTDFPGGDHVALVQSIQKRLLTLPSDTVVWPGHGYGGQNSTIGAERSCNPFVTGTL
jgi:glyoxylase-like metal-dependent hydrolase (beta-lactamase superfamily II)